MDHLGWRSRGYLPHCDAAGLFQHIVFSLADALPLAPKNLNADQSVAWTEAELDRGHGSRVLARNGIASILEDCLLHEDGVRYHLIAWCVMPTHAHVIIEQFPNVRLDVVVQSWKSVSAHRINAVLGTNGRLWRREYFDRFMRDNDHLSTTIAYVEANPVKAGLAANAQDWRFSSARRRGV